VPTLATSGRKWCRDGWKIDSGPLLMDLSRSTEAGADIGHSPCRSGCQVTRLGRTESVES
jgi:hypothetical protein